MEKLTLKKTQKIFSVGAAALLPFLAVATPSSTYWAPSTASCQAWGVSHLGIDGYFAAEDTSAPDYPTDYGLTVGVLPFEKIQAEVGVDYFAPASYPLAFNGKICTPEGSVFNQSPSFGVGIYNAGFIKDVNDMNVLYAVFQKTIPGIGGYVALGVYHGLNKDLMKSSSGDVNQTGLLAALASPDIVIGYKGLQKVNFVADLQTGKNVLGAWGFGSNIYFAENVSVLTGPVFFLDKDSQPGKKAFFWTAQLDVDIPLEKIAH